MLTWLGISTLHPLLRETMLTRLQAYTPTFSQILLRTLAHENEDFY